jgi:hypothetical protein
MLDKDKAETFIPELFCEVTTGGMVICSTIFSICFTISTGAEIISVGFAASCAVSKIGATGFAFSSSIEKVALR